MNFAKILKKKISLAVMSVLVIAGGLFGYNVFATPDATITPATGGTSISIDTTSNGGTGAWVPLTGPVITEGASGDIHTGVHTLTLPTGWEFKISTVTIAVGGDSNIGGLNTNITPGATTLSFNVTTASTVGTATLTFQNIEVRPTNTAVATGNITLTAGVINTADTNYGTLTTIAGTVTKLGFTTQPATTQYGSAIQPVVKTEDQFGNPSIIGLGASETVTITQTAGTGTLSGDIDLDIGTGGGNGNGIVTFTDLKIDTIGAGKKLTATGATLPAVQSTAFDLTTKALTVTGITADGKGYNGLTPAVVHTGGADFVGRVGADVVVIELAGVTGDFVDKNAGIGKTVNISGVAKSGANAANYTIIQPTTTATITKKATDGSFTVAATRVYDSDVDATLLTATVTSKIALDDVALTGTPTYASEDVGGPIVVTLGSPTLTGTDATNYTLGTVATTAAGITARPITITAGTDTKIYDNNTSSDGTSTVTSGSLAGSDTIAAITQTFDTKNVGSGKTLTAAGVVTDGNGGANYDVTFETNTTGVIRHGEANYFVVTPSTLNPTTATPISVTVTAVDAYGNTANGANGAEAYVGNFYMITDATAPTWYTQNGKIENDGAKVVSNCLLFNTAELGKTITANSHVGTLTGNSEDIDIAAGPDTTAPTISSVAPSGITNIAATISWATDIAATNNIVEYGITSALGTYSSADSNATSHAVALSSLVANTTYYYRVKSVAGGSTSTSQILNFKTAAAANGVSATVQTLKSYATADGLYADGWEFKFNVTVNNASEGYLKMKFADWAGASALPASSTMKISLVDDVEGVDDGDVGVSIGNLYANQSNANALELSDEDLSTGGIQDTIYVYVKVPVGTSGGSYSTSYGIKTGTTNAIAEAE